MFELGKNLDTRLGASLWGSPQGRCWQAEPHPVCGGPAGGDDQRHAWAPVQAVPGVRPGRPRCCAPPVWLTTAIPRPGLWKCAWWRRSQASHLWSSSRSCNQGWRSQAWRASRSRRHTPCRSPSPSNDPPCAAQLLSAAAIARGHAAVQSYGAQRTSRKMSSQRHPPARTVSHSHSRRILAAMQQAALVAARWMPAGKPHDGLHTVHRVGVPPPPSASLRLAPRPSDRRRAHACERRRSVARATTGGGEEALHDDGAASTLLPLAQYVE